MLLFSIAICINVRFRIALSYNLNYLIIQILKLKEMIVNNVFIKKKIIFNIFCIIKKNNKVKKLSIKNRVSSVNKYNLVVKNLFLKTGENVMTQSKEIMTSQKKDNDNVIGNTSLYNFKFIL